MNSNIDIEIKQDSITTGIRFTSFIVINRHLNIELLRRPNLYVLLTYIALRVKRSSELEFTNLTNIDLNIGEFIIGRLSTVRDLDLTEAEYRSNFKKLQEWKIIEVVKVTNKYTKCRWLENSFVDVNLEIPLVQQNDQQTSSQPTTNNNINNTNKYIPIIRTIFPNIDNSIKDSYIRVLNGYVEYKGIELRGEEIKKVLYVIKQMFDSDRKPEQIIGLMQWFKKYENHKEYPWIKGWTLNTVQRKLPEFIAGKLKIHSWGDEYPKYQKN